MVSATASKSEDRRFEPRQGVRCLYVTMLLLQLFIT
jgi:hypothetical protein